MANARSTVLSWTGDAISNKNPAFSPITVAIATDIAHHQKLQQTFMRTLWFIRLLVPRLSFGVGVVCNSRGLRPLRSMARDASEITANRLKAFA